MFDRLSGVVYNSKGRVLTTVDQGFNVEAGLFVVGWLKRGPTGIIGDNLNDADETVIFFFSLSTIHEVPRFQFFTYLFFTRQVQCVDEDWTTGALGLQTNSCPLGGQGLQALLEARCIPFVTFADWLKIHTVELERGSKKGKPQEKIVSKDDMLTIARQVSS